MQIDEPLNRTAEGFTGWGLAVQLNVRHCWTVFTRVTLDCRLVQFARPFPQNGPRGPPMQP
jgi:hypothetical protein